MDKQVLKNITDQSGCNIKVIFEPENVINTSLELISEAKEKFDCYLDNRGLSYFIESEPLWKAITGLRNKDITLRLATEITPKTVHDCSLIMKHSEVFHSDRIKGNFLIIDGIKYLCYVMDEDDYEGKQPAKQLFYTGIKLFVDTQQYLFDNLCNHSIPAKEKIREIGRGIKGDFVDIIQTPSEIQKVAIELMESATYEILLLFPTTNSFYRAEYSGMLNSLWKLHKEV